MTGEEYARCKARLKRNRRLLFAFCACAIILSIIF
ncbi:hypothetical protein B1VFA_005 [Rhizobium phage B1VFA]|nr:hypothetical protein B1VFA_005 [Rhizobium phage B1VFA]